MIRFVDLFAGIGGFRLGLEKASMAKNSETRRGNTNTNVGRKRTPKGSKFLCVYSCEIDKYCQKIYAKNFGKEPEGADIRTVRPEDIPEAELYTFGWPCQDNSIAGKRKGQAVDTRSGLLFEAVRIIRAKKPDYFLAENVPGLFSVSGGCDFYETVRMFTDSGYDCQWQVLNTRWFLPQNRQRIFFVGHLRGEPRPEVFPVTEKMDRVGQEHRKAKEGFCNIAQALKARDYGNWNGTYCEEDSKIRRLTPTECERLQGFSDGWTEGVSDTQRYKCIGNAVTVDVVECIGRKLLTP